MVIMIYFRLSTVSGCSATTFKKVWLGQIWNLGIASNSLDLGTWGHAQSAWYMYMRTFPN
jgi:hypothetical protein